MSVITSFKNTLPKINYDINTNKSTQQQPIAKQENKKDTLQIGSFKIKKKLLIEIGIAYLIKLIIITPFVHSNMRKALRARSEIFNWICKQGEKFVLPIILPVILPIFEIAPPIKKLFGIVETESPKKV